ncbi:hypothetical protein phiV141_7 [Vibrio phage phiV141]|uniref:Uncharacterized protein n=1 Tax=Vibrio phage phiV141 TaxID=2723905 RepID=A0A7D7IKF7_9CAUD|nr:hypothetical protein phiV141_7 [Vibrio phage phiV141]
MKNLKRISNVHQLIELMAYVWWKQETIADAYYSAAGNKFELSFQLNGKVIAEVRKLTPNMVQKPWWSWFKQDYVFVDEKLFRQMANDIYWQELTAVGQVAVLRVMRTKLEVRNVSLVHRQ